MRFGSITVVIAAVCACGAVAIAADADESTAISVRLRVDPSISSRHITERVQTETAAIWAMYGIRIEWAGAEPAARAAYIVSLDASIERRFESPRRVQWPPVLGRVVMQRGSPFSRPIAVSLDATERVLADRPAGRSPPGIVLEQELARALGRVLAHEIGHVLLGRDHDRAGLMRATFRPEELGEADRAPFRLVCDGARRLEPLLRLNGGDPASARTRDAGVYPAFNQASCIALHKSR